MKLTVLLPCLLLALRCASACAQTVESDWVSYRDAYRSMIWFEKYGKPKQLLQNHYRIIPRDKSVSLDGLRVTLNSKSAQLNLPLDALGRIVLPMSKAAFDDNAVLSFNRKVSQFMLTPWVSIQTRADGVYDTAELRSACEQHYAYLRYMSDSQVSGKKCSGVQFVYARSEFEPDVRLRKADHSVQTLPSREGGAFWGETSTQFRVVAYRFAGMPDDAQLLTRNAPLTIAPIFE